MGFRFRRSVRILPGVKLNFSGSGTSVSLGTRGFHYTLGPKGTRVTAGIPGTGLSWSQYSSHSKNHASMRQSKVRAQFKRGATKCQPNDVADEVGLGSL